jgi:hypothetical protein
VQCSAGLCTEHHAELSSALFTHRTADTVCFQQGVQVQPHFATATSPVIVNATVVQWGNALCQHQPVLHCILQLCTWMSHNIHQRLKASTVGQSCTVASASTKGSLGVYPGMGQQIVLTKHSPAMLHLTGFGKTISESQVLLAHAQPVTNASTNLPSSLPNPKFTCSITSRRVVRSIHTCFGKAHHMT